MNELTNLKKFIFNAKQHTYASSKDGDEIINDDRSYEFKYQDKEFLYRDRYFGIDPFTGQEVVYYKNSPVWCMNYYGYTLENSKFRNEIFIFLKTALIQLNENYPFRGINNLRIGKFQYINKYKGDLLRFSGHEVIYYEKRIVYYLDYFGGEIKDQ
ncbi:hypothetical protein LN42_01315 [Marinitoga sp. 1137]|uniref:DUF5680 domain-containing protein n=1 Tax=Marinitoga sp. 1137 TaxID=1545835 RepID=UPI0009507E91|nr:DUF5680 domain-containing protein [Marinitoga sp. 1137]APT75185.1 hypothetical protein LN42_01315 [Marinitoga sp. 1137]